MSVLIKSLVKFVSPRYPGEPRVDRLLRIDKRNKITEEPPVDIVPYVEPARTAEIKRQQGNTDPKDPTKDPKDPPKEPPIDLPEDPVEPVEPPKEPPIDQPLEPGEPIVKPKE